MAFRGRALRIELYQVQLEQFKNRTFEIEKGLESTNRSLASLRLTLTIIWPEMMQSGKHLNDWLPEFRKRVETTNPKDLLLLEEIDALTTNQNDLAAQLQNQQPPNIRSEQDLPHLRSEPKKVYEIWAETNGKLPNYLVVKFRDHTELPSICSFREQEIRMALQRTRSLNSVASLLQLWGREWEEHSRS